MHKMKSSNQNDQSNFKQEKAKLLNIKKEKISGSPGRVFLDRFWISNKHMDFVKKGVLSLF